MPSVSKKQKHFMAMSASVAGRKRLRQYGSKPAPMSVAKEWVRADAGGKRKKKR